MLAQLDIYRRGSRTPLVLLALMTCGLGAISPRAFAGSDEIFCGGFDTISVCRQAPSPFLVVPTRVSALALTPITAYLTSDPPPPVSGSPVTSLVLLGPSGESVPLSIVSDVATPNRVDALIPVGLAPGVWGLRSTTDDGYVGLLAQALTITNTTTTLSLSGAVPNVVSNNALTRIDLAATDPAPSGSESFVVLPEVFLHANGASSTPAVRIEDRELLSAAQFRVSIPAGLAPGAYDVIAIDPDGSTGVLSSGLTIVASAAPKISKLVPATAIDQTAQSITLRGTNFGAAAPTVSATCVDSAGANAGFVPGVAAAPTSTSVAVTFDFSTLGSDSQCRIDLTTIDGLRTSYSNLPILSPSLYCLGGSSTITGQTLLQGRRAGVLLAGPIATEGHRLYMIGGDTGIATGALSSVESTSVDGFGALGAFRQERYALPTALTFSAGVRVGDYLYVVGGNDGTGPTNSAYRSRVLRDQRTPRIIDLEALPAPAPGGLGAGLWHYRIAPRFPSNDPDNPDGEGLPGALLSVELPPIANGTQPTLTWNVVAGANDYVVYRTPTAGMATMFERLAVVSAPATAYTDAGAATVLGQTPLPTGSLANWRSLPVLTANREGAGVAAAADPVNANRWYVYAIAGKNSPTLALTSDEFIQVDVGIDASQSVAASWVSGIASLGQAREHLGVWAMDADDTPLITAPTTYVYSGPGATVAGGAANAVDAAQVQAGGNWIAWDSSPKDVTTSNVGGALAQARECLFLIGGTSGLPSAGIIKAVVVGPPPTLAANSWNTSGTTLQRGRVFAGAAIANGFIFVAGGQSDALMPADNTVERVAQ